MNAIGERLREERKRLGMNQEDFGALAGVKKNAQIKYESGERSPTTAYLAELVSAGVDVQYVFTGRRQDAPTRELLAPHEVELLDAYRELPSDLQGKLRGYAEAWLAAAVRGDRSSSIRRRHTDDDEQDE